MSLEQLERDVAELKEQVASLLAKPKANNSQLMAARGVLKDFPEFADVQAFGHYFRVTGQLPPDDWNPGDPIPTNEATL
jgi:hypothetical protein